MYCKCICTHHNNASIYKANGNSHKRGNQQQCTIGRDFNMPLTSPFRSSKQKVNKKIQVLNDTLDQINLFDIYRTIHQETIEHNFFSSAHGLFSRIDHILGHKSSLNKFMKIEFISNNFSDHNAMRLEINYRKKKEKKPAKKTEAHGS